MSCRVKFLISLEAPSYMFCDFWNEQIDHYKNGIDTKRFVKLGLILLTKNTYYEKGA